MWDIVIELSTAVTRWSRQRQHKFFMSGTLWHGMMCRTFLLLEQILRSALAEFSPIVEEEMMQAAKRRAAGKPVSSMTFGQCLGVMEELAPFLSEEISNKYSELSGLCPLLPDSDLQLWKRVVFLRNRLAHDGPGFFDAVDFNAGRIWRNYSVAEPLEDQAEEAWQICRHLCSSSLIMIGLAMKGIPPEVARRELSRAEQAVLDLQSAGEDFRTLSHVANRAVDEFHTSSARRTDEEA